MPNPTLISMINLGCTKNLVDSQFLLGKFLSGDSAGKDEENLKNPPFPPFPQ
jgi:tRNA A37 methylthiotransferase MiaB